MNLVRHELGFSKTAKRFPAKGTCLAIYSRVVNAQAEIEPVLARASPGAPAGRTSCARFSGPMSRRQAGAERARLRRSAALVVADDGRARARSRYRRALRSRPRRRIPGHEPPAGGDPPRPQAGRARAHGGGDDAQSIYAFRAATVRNILDFPTQFTPPPQIVTLDRNYRSTQPILEAANAVIGFAKERFTKNLWTDRVSSDKPALVICATRPIRRATWSRRCSRTARPGSP
jgi:DNA helicase II / ATP-dependent DNA helicase PcrA